MTSKTEAWNLPQKHDDIEIYIEYGSTTRKQKKWVGLYNGVDLKPCFNILKPFHEETMQTLL
jgi:hypothetical protein